MKRHGTSRPLNELKAKRRGVRAVRIGAKKPPAGIADEIAEKLNNKSAALGHPRTQACGLDSAVIPAHEACGIKQCHHIE
jgi:hypothetical protein